MFNNYVLDSFLRNSHYSGVENYTRYTVARLGMLPIKNVKPLIPEFGPVINDVLSFRYPINIPSCPAAEIKMTRLNPSVFIAIISEPYHFKERNDIRETWLIHLKSALGKNLLGMGTRFGFFLGQTHRYDRSSRYSIQKRIEEESQKHGDIVQIELGDNEEAYLSRTNALANARNRTLKVIAVLNWVRQHCAKVDLVSLLDESVYVNVHNLVHFVRSINHQSSNSLFGESEHANLLKRDAHSSIEEYPWSHYPNYLKGYHGYFMHSSVVIPLLAASQTTPLITFGPYFNADRFLTGMCREKAGVKLQNFKTDWMPGLDSPVPCDLRRAVCWLTSDQFSTHSAVDDFYRNKTQCVIKNYWDEIKETIDFTAPVIFKFP